MPDLVAVEEGTSVYLEGTVYYDSTGTVLGEDVTVTGTCTIRNDGYSPAIGSRSPDHAIYNYCYFYDDATSTGYIDSFRGTTVDPIAVGETYMWEDSNQYTNDFGPLQEIYDGAAADVYVAYDIDYATTSYVVESDETNNEEGFTIALDSSMYSINWIEVECTSDSDCGSGYVCEAYVCTEDTGESTYG